ncbi:MAG: YdiU family protein [Comamonadaceae bacterium]|nr:MAG: YdiU family protein [Comamonadaceae bacterium]
MPSPTTTPSAAPRSGLAWRNGFAELGPSFFTELVPTPLPAPYWVGTSASAAEWLGVHPQWLASDTALQVFSGNAMPAGARPLASVYSGHQFGVWAGQLGDGRAILLGETDRGIEVQLKGAGRTPYSRGGDGRAVLRSSIREFLCSEAMHALGVPTTRALCITGSPAPVYREEAETAAVVTRLAPSFIRFGHFEHFSARGQEAELRQLADYMIDRYYPDCRTNGAQTLGGNAYAALLQAVSERTAALLAQWQAIGFCHGVMNTDNMSILGLTIDYGPFQFLDAFVPGHICNHSDSQGRYAFNRQPNVAYWNLFCLGQALMPLIGDTAIAQAALESYKTAFPTQFMRRMRAKLGVQTAREEDGAFIDALLQLLAQDAVDYPIFWRRLSHAVATSDFEPVRDLFLDRAGWDRWLLSYQELIATENHALASESMLRTNPKFVLRNHAGELAIRAAHQGDLAPFNALQSLLADPFEEHADQDAHWSGFPPDWASTIEISCSS